MSNLWPKFNPIEIPNPKNAMKEQAKYLFDNTKRKIQGSVATRTSGENIYHTFVIIAPKLGNYRFTLFTISHSVNPFPLDFHHNKERVTINSIDELNKKMEEVFNLPDTIQKITTMMSVS